MICRVDGCKKETCDPEGICGFCRLQNVLAEYTVTQRAKEWVLNMPPESQITVDRIGYRDSLGTPE